MPREWISRNRAMEAPKAAPADIPKVYGSARGLSKMPWNITPEMDSPAPTIAEVNIRGNLTSHTT